ncbi:hypothetical protein SCAR479_00365 [Seiridium cardinale]|uniref:Phospholipase A2 n=1 Tax=Seiridium cardinale TaxID=138064 RepID=A0ABR2Y9A1_9PEZI
MKAISPLRALLAWSITATGVEGIYNTGPPSSLLGHARNSSSVSSTYPASYSRNRISAIENLTSASTYIHTSSTAYVGIDETSTKSKSGNISSTISTKTSNWASAHLSTGTGSFRPSASSKSAASTYHGVELPTFTTTFDSGHAPTTTEIYSITQTPSTSCVIDSSSLDQPFRIATNNSVPLIPKNERIGLLEDADFPGTDEAVNEAFFNNLPTFTFRATADGPVGYYDLAATINSTMVYVSLDPTTLEVHTTPTSSNGQFNVSRGLITSIFSFSCDGRVLISDEHTDYAWRLGSDGINTVMTVGTPADTHRFLIVSEKSPVAASKAEGNFDKRSLSLRHRRFAAISSLERRISPYTDGAVPRVPDSPPDLVSKPRPGARAMRSNGCGSGSTSSWIPQLDFGTCCDNHDFCYDNCQSGTVEDCHNEYCSPGEFERCNDKFYDCMHDTACSQYSWEHPVQRSTCILEAKFYHFAVSHFGAGPFKSATSDRCGVYCPNGNALCHGECLTFDGNDNDNCGSCGYTCATSHNFECQSGQCVCTADTQNDDNNCGDCGRICPANTHCSGGECACDADQCGNLCVDLQDNPNNCGTCGNICTTGNCSEGQCVHSLDS